MNKGDLITGRLAGFSYVKWFNEETEESGSLCIVTIETDAGTKHKANLGDAGAYPFKDMLSLRKQGVTCSAVCKAGGKDTDKHRFNQVTFDL